MKAVTSLNGTPLPFNESGRLTLQLVHSAKMKISERIYKAVDAKIQPEAQVWRSKHLHFIPYEPDRGYRVLRLEGEISKEVAQAKNTLEQILAGETAMYDDKPVWIPSLLFNGETYRALQEIEQRIGVVIVRNKRLSRLQIYGSSARCREAAELLAALAKEDSSKRRVIELDEQKFVWACHGGFNAISAALSQGTVAFDILSNPKRILVTGSEDDYRLAVRMVTDQKNSEHLGKRRPTTGEECAICWTEAENPVQTRCNHSYCADCFERFCFSGVTESREGGIRCAGDLSKCAAILALEELLDNLPSSTFEDLLEASFTSHIRRFPQNFRYCPTPDCGQVYRATDTGSTFNSSKCLTPVCTKCHVNHQGMTCAEHRDFASGGYAALEKTKKRLGIKDCPKCKTPIEKTEGCNHMICGGCQTHICWKCMQTFNEEDACYAHMNKEHGSIGLEFAGLDLY